MVQGLHREMRFLFIWDTDCHVEFALKDGSNLRRRGSCVNKPEAVWPASENCHTTFVSQLTWHGYGRYVVLQWLELVFAVGIVAQIMTRQLIPGQRNGSNAKGHK